MHSGKTFLAIIPARGGSKRLPRKNVLLLAGKPLVAWSIEAAKKSNYIDQILLTSDCEDILDIGRKHNIHTLKRPDHLALDTATGISVLRHAVKCHDQHDFIVQLQPTSPLRTHQHIDEAIDLLVRKNADAILSVTEADHNPLWMNTLPPDADMSQFLDNQIKGKRSQDLPTYYQIHGAIVICNSERLLLEQTCFLKNNIYAYKMSRESSVDIDNKIDFMFADFLMKSMRGF